MLPPNAIRKLKEDLESCFDARYSSESGDFLLTLEEREYFSRSYKVQNIDSAFIDFYSIVAIPPLGNGPELMTLSRIEDANADEEDPENPLTQDPNFVRFTSGEGGGSYWFNLNSDSVFDVTWGEEVDVIQGTLKPIFTTFYSFLESYYSAENVSA